MKRLIIGLLVVVLLCLIAGCDTSITPPSDPSTPDTSQPPEASEPEPEPVFIEVPLSYEAEGYVLQDMACVEVKNTDTVPGTFLVIFSAPEPTKRPTIIDIPDFEQDFFEAFRKAELLRPKDYEVLEAKSRYETAYVTLRNTDKVAATFTVTFSFEVTTLDYDYDGHPYIETHESQAEKDIYLEPGEEGTVKASAEYYGENSSMTCSYNVWPGIEFPEQSATSSGDKEEAISELLERYQESINEARYLFSGFPSEQELEIEPGETAIAECLTAGLSDWSFEVIPSTKLVEQ